MITSVRHALLSIVTVHESKFKTIPGDKTGLKSQNAAYTIKPHSSYT